ncbi:MAG: bifunctional riboflavin kinase/FAD synthetase [Microcoleaceae cyanobacterium]
MWITSSPNIVLTPTAVALGNFDGLHRGHQRVIDPTLNASDKSQWPTSAQQLSQVQSTQADFSPSFSLSDSASVGQLSTSLSSSRAAAEYCYSTVVTFHPHPQEFFTGKTKPLLTPHDEKVERLKQLGVEQLILLPFNRDLAVLTPDQFVENILVKQLHARRVSVGFDFQFGKNRAGTAIDLQSIAADYGIEVIIVPRYPCEQGERISSSLIRQALQQGDVQRAQQLLGYYYRLVGQVVQGQQLGRTIGFPTANLQLPPEKFLPRYGVYAVWVELQPQPGQESCRKMAVMNIGCRPTVAGESPTIEVHLLNYSGDLYHQTLSVDLVEFLRPEQKFESIEQLKAQIELDCVRATEILNDVHPQNTSSV